MNVLPCEVGDGRAVFAGNSLQTASVKLPAPGSGSIEIGVRPEFIRFNDSGIPVEIVKVTDLGRCQVIEVTHQGHAIKMIADEDVQIPSESPRIAFAPEATRLYVDGWIVN